MLSGNEELLISLIKYYIPNPLETNPPFASTVLVNLFKEDGQYYVTFEINGSIIKLGSACKESTKWELSKVVYALNEKGMIKLNLSVTLFYSNSKYWREMQWYKEFRISGSSWLGSCTYNCRWTCLYSYNDSSLFNKDSKRSKEI